MSWLPNWITGHDAENQARGDAAAAELTRLKDEKIASGYYTAEQAIQIQKNYETDAYLNEEEAQEAIGEAFDEGWEEGRQNVSNAISGTLNKVVGGPLRAILGGIPWWLWLAAILGVVGYFGGFAWLKKKVL